jgi:hypothetical protein
MRKAGIFILGLCFVLTSGVQAHAWFGSKKKEAASTEETQAATETGKQAAPAAAAPKVDKALEKTLKEKREAVAKKMALLNNNEWQIELSPAGGKGKKELDAVAIKNNQVSMAGFLKKGFSASNFTLTLQEDGSVIWETMQTSEKAGICFWRGELDKTLTTMRGVLSHVIDNKNKIDYTFASTSRRALPTDK